MTCETEDDCETADDCETEGDDCENCETESEDNCETVKLKMTVKL